MKKLLKQPIFIASCLVLFSLGSKAQDPFAAGTAEISKEYKSKDRVLEEVLFLDSTSNSTSMKFYLPKGKYVVYVIADTFSQKSASFSIKGNSMEWETKDKDQRKIVSEGKGFKQKKWIVSNPINATEKYGTLEFKVDDIMNLMNNAGAKMQANYEAQLRANRNAMATRGQVIKGTAHYTKYENGAELEITISADAANILHPWGAVKVLVFER